MVTGDIIIRAFPPQVDPYNYFSLSDFLGGTIKAFDELEFFNEEYLVRFIRDGWKIEIYGSEDDDIFPDLFDVKSINEQYIGIFIDYDKKLLSINYKHMEIFRMTYDNYTSKQVTTNNAN